jgi:hypothetical protein
MASVFKYRGGNFKRDIECLTSNTFWSPTINNLNDPCEGFVDSEEIKSQVKVFAKIMSANQISKETKKHINILFEAIEGIIDRKNKVGIYSLSKNRTNDLLWSYYADGHKGFCIEYDLDNLTELIPKNLKHIIPIVYSKTPPKLDLIDISKLKENGGLNIIQKILGYKSIKWSHEEELRIITDSTGSNNHNNNAIKSISFGSRIDSNEKEKIIKSLSERDIKFYQMVIDKNNYSLKAQEL